jgi:hypothetical protein
VVTCQDRTHQPTPFPAAADRNSVPAADPAWQHRITNPNQPITVTHRRGNADRRNQQIAQWLALELELPQHIKHLATQRLAGLFQLLQQGLVDIAFTGLIGNQIPQVAHLCLANPMDTPKALF